MMKAKNSKRYITGLAAVAAAALLLTVVTGAGVAGSKDEDRGYIGVYMQELDKDLLEGLDIDVKHGVLITGVEKGSPADEAGIEDGDVIVEFNGSRITGTDQLRELVADTEAGEKVIVKVLRDGETKTIALTVGEWSDDFTWQILGDLHSDSKDWHGLGRSVRAFMFKPRLGVQATELNKDLAPYFKTKTGKGVLVLEVNEESVAEEAGILAGDVILSVGGEEVTSVDELRGLMEDYEEGDEFDIGVIRKGKKKTFKATMDDSGENFLWSGRTPHVYKFDHNFRPNHFRKSFGPYVEVLKDDLADDLEDLRRELKQMRKELDELKNR